MSSLHLSHALPWAQFAEKDFVVYNDPGISLPTGRCKLIHLSNKKTKCQVENRKYLQDKICLSSNCETDGEKVFYKRDKKSYTLSRGIPQQCTCTHFVDCFKKAITEFADSYSKKYLREVSKRSSKQGVSKNINTTKVDIGDQEVEKKLRLEAEEVLDRDKGWKAPADYGLWWHFGGGCPCQLITILMEAKQLSTILSLDAQVLTSFFSCQHGGQAVGNNFGFLLYHVLHVYIYTNLIICCNLENEPEKWGRMEPSSFFRSLLMYDCDGQTFLQASRKYLSNEIYMKDFNAMKQLLKDCFEFIYFSKILWDKVNPDGDFFKRHLYFWFDCFTDVY